MIYAFQKKFRASLHDWTDVTVDVTDGFSRRLALLNTLTLFV